MLHMSIALKLLRILLLLESKPVFVSTGKGACSSLLSGVAQSRGVWVNVHPQIALWF